MSEIPMDSRQTGNPENVPVTSNRGGTANRIAGFLTERRRSQISATNLRTDLARDSRLGYGYLSIGVTIVGALLFLRGVLLFALDWSVYPQPVLTAGSWAALAVMLLIASILGNRVNIRLPLPLYLIGSAVIALAIAVDVVASLGGTTRFSPLSTFIGAGAIIFSLITLVPLRWSLIATGALFAGMLAVEIFVVGQADYELGPHLAGTICVLAPLLIGISVVRGFGELIQRELDRSLVESTLAAPRLAFGMLASDELARLDLAAEELLQDVATGKSALPLSAELAAQAAGLASELRLLLVAGRNETWLSHAIEESEFLGPVVQLVDTEGLAGYLDSSQRDGLLSAIWLLVGDSNRTQPFISLTIGPRTVAQPYTRTDSIRFTVDITIDGVSRRKIDSAVWAALDRVSPHTELPSRGQFRIVLSVSTVAQDTVR